MRQAAPLGSGLSLCSAEFIACIEVPLVVKKIFEHLDTKSTPPVDYLVESRAPPRQGLLFTSE